MMPTYELSNNNSGGSFWIGRKEMDALLAAGWYVDPEYKPYFGVGGSDDNYFGSGCTAGELHALRVKRDSAQQAIEEFEKLTGQDFFALGCTCCGAPFTLYELGEGDTRNYLKSWGGDSVPHTPQRPF